MDEAREFEEHRPRLVALAYRMVGSVAEAEDLVQEAYLRLHHARAEGTRVESPAAYLTTVTTRLAIDHLRSARVRRERYVGTWLPEPLLTDRDADVERHAETADSLSLAFLVLLETLSPVERAVFLLHDVFGFGHDEIARTIGKSVENSRQIGARARRHIEARRPRFDASRRQRDELAGRFFEAIGAGDMDGLVELLAADAVMYGDGGGKAPSISEPIHGAERVARFLLGLARQARHLGIVLRPTHVNAQPGLIAFDGGGRVVSVMALDIADGRVQTIHSIVNPEKLGHLGEVADLGALMRGEG